MTANSYPDLSKSDRKDSLIPDPQEFDFSDPDRSDDATLPARDRLDLFKRLVEAGQMVRTLTR